MQTRRHWHFFITSDNQFGFKKLYGCSYTVGKTVEYFTKSGITVNFCPLHLLKAFDKANHFGLYNILMNEAVPIILLKVWDCRFRIQTTCVRFGSVMSSFASLECGVRREVLYHLIFSIFIDDVIKQKSNSKC